MLDVSNKTKATRIIQNTISEFFSSNPEVILPDMLKELSERILNNLNFYLKTDGDIVVRDHRT